MTSEEILHLARECGAKQLMSPTKHQNLGLMGNEVTIAFADAIENRTRQKLQEADAKFEKRIAGVYGSVKEL